MSTERVHKGVKEGGQFAASSRPETAGVSLGSDAKHERSDRYAATRVLIKVLHTRVGKGLARDWDYPRLRVASAAVDCAEAGSIIKKEFPDAITFGITIPKDTGTPRFDVFDRHGTDLLSGIDAEDNHHGVNDPTGSRAAAAKQAGELLVPKGEQPNLERMQGLIGNMGRRIVILMSGEEVREHGDYGKQNKGNSDLRIAIRIPQPPFDAVEIPHVKLPPLPKAP